MIIHALQVLKSVAEGRSPGWPTFRKKVIAKLKAQGRYFCPVCATTTKLELHHINPYWAAPLEELDENNVLIVCRPHHLSICHLENFKRWNKHVREDIAYWAKRLSAGG